MHGEPWTDERKAARFAELTRYELIGAATLVFFVAVFLQTGWVTSMSAIATLPATLLLLQGALFWWLELRRLRRPGDVVAWFAPAFRAFRVINLVVLVACVAVVVLRLPGAGTGDRIVSVVMLVLGMAEYVNYFHWQLMYDNRTDLSNLAKRRRLKRSLLWRRLSQTA